MKITKTILSFLLLSTLLNTSCNSDEEVEKDVVSFIAKVSTNAEDTIKDKANGAISDASAHSGKYIYRTDSINEYSGGQEFNLNDSLMNSTLRVCFNFWAKSSIPSKEAGLAIAFQTTDEMVSFTMVDLLTYGAKPNEWVNIVDSIIIPHEYYNKPGMLFKVFGHSPAKKGIMDLDDINVTFKKIETIEEK